MGLVCNILSYCHLALAHPQRALEVQQHVSGNQATNRNLFVEVYRVFVLALGQLRQGDLQEAERQAIQALHHAEHHTGQNSSSGATLAPLLAEIAWERGDSEQVNSLLNLRLGMIDDFCPSDGLSLCYVVLARQAQLNAQPDEAMTLYAMPGNCVERGWWRARIALLAEEITST
jgi:LuxR family maltose regulon positive regulatory protein